MLSVQEGKSCEQLQAQNWVSGVARCWCRFMLKVIKEMGVSIENEIRVRAGLPEGIMQN